MQVWTLEACFHLQREESLRLKEASLRAGFETLQMVWEPILVQCSPSQV